MITTQNSTRLFDLEKLKSWDPSTFRKEMAAGGFGPNPDQQVEPSKTLIDLFIRGIQVKEEVVRQELSKSCDELISLGLLNCGGGTIGSNLRFRPVGDGIFADDFPQRLQSKPDDFVMGVAATTRALPLIVPPISPTKVLDLCCGGGWLAISQCAPGVEVVGTDLLPRALEVAKFNAALNEAGEIDWRVGSWYEAVAGETFDLILANPPFVISPGSQSIALDAPDNKTVLPAVLEGLSERLNPGGYAVSLLNWPFMSAEDRNQIPLDILAGQNLQIFLFEMKCESPEEYAKHWVSQDTRFTEPDRKAAEVSRWVESFHKQEYQGASSGFLVARRCEPGEEWVKTDSRSMPELNSKTPEDLARMFEGQSWLKNAGANVFETPLELAQGLVLSSAATLEGTSWETANLKLSSSGALAYDGQIDEPVLQILNGIREGKTLAEILAEMATEFDIEKQDLAPQVEQLVKELISKGIILPREDRESE